MGVVLGKAKELIEAVGELGVVYVLQLFGYLMHFVPGVFQLFQQENLPQPVLANDEQGYLFAFLGKPYTLALFVLYELFVHQLFEHIHHRRRIVVQGVGYGRWADLHFSILPEVVDHLQVVLFRKRLYMDCGGHYVKVRKV